MATITVRVEDRTKGELEALARARGVTVSDIVRQYIETEHGTSERGDDAAPPRSLSLQERHNLVLMHTLLAKIGDDNYSSGYHERAVEALTMGYSAEYSQEFSGYAREMPRRDCELVQNILDLFRAITNGLRELPEAEKEQLSSDELEDLQFSGFDGNDDVEGMMMSYARYLIENGKWQELKPQFDANDGGNSHTQMLGRYQRMLDVYRPIAERRIRSMRRQFLTLEQLRALASV